MNKPQWSQPQWGDTFLLVGYGLVAREAVDIVCGGCGSTLVRDRYRVAHWTFFRSGYVLIEDVEHQCEGDLETARPLMLCIPSADVRAMEQSVGL